MEFRRFEWLGCWVLFQEKGVCKAEGAGSLKHLAEERAGAKVRIWGLCRVVELAVFFLGGEGVGTSELILSPRCLPAGEGAAGGNHLLCSKR